MKKKRMSPYELEEYIFDAVEGRRWATRQSWREVHKEALLLWVEKHKEIASLIPASPENGDGCAHASHVERLPNLAPVATSLPAEAVAVEAAPVIPAVVLSENEKRLERLYAGRALKQEFWDQGIIELAADPGNVRAANWVRVMPGEVGSYNAEIKVCEALIAAEKLAKENSGEVVPGEEV